jgi:hypothetical protein
MPGPRQKRPIRRCRELKHSRSSVHRQPVLDRFAEAWARVDGNPHQLRCPSLISASHVDDAGLQRVYSPEPEIVRTALSEDCQLTTVAGIPATCRRKG